MKVCELQKYDGNASVMIVTNGRLRPVTNVVAKVGMPLIILMSEPPARAQTRFSKQEDGFIVGASAYGVSHEAMAQLLGRSPDSIKKRRAKLGISLRGIQKA